LTIHVLGTPFHPAHTWPLDRGIRDVVRVVLPRGLAPGTYVLADRLFWRTDDDQTGLAEADDPDVRARSGLVPLGTIEVTP
jgi:hypothetical protein